MLLANRIKPKRERTSYFQAKSFRPISLRYILLKTLERLVDSYIRARASVEYPLHCYQHAHQTGRAVRTALCSLVYKSQRTLEDGLIALGAFPDIEGGFDNTTFESLCKAAKDLKSIWWSRMWQEIRSMLRSRQFVTIQMGCRSRVSVDRESPQRGVLSPVLWSPVLDGHLARFSREGLYTQGYADDLALLLNGKL
jgi:hypothetical protein